MRQEITTLGGLVPPQAIDLEESVLGTIIDQGHSVDIVIDILSEDAFYLEQNKIVFGAISALYMMRSKIDLLTVTAQLRKMGRLEMVGGAFFVTNLTQKVVNGGSNIEKYAYLIKEAYYKREIIRISQETIRNAYQDTSDAFELVEDLSKVYDLVSSDVGKSIQSVGKIFRERLRAYELIVSSGITGVPSGFTDLDRITAGWQKSDLIIAAGRPGMGKTAFVVNCARNAAVDFGKPVLVFSMEMTKEQLVDRIVSAEAEVDSGVIRKRTFVDTDWAAIHRVSDKIDMAQIHIDDTPALSIVQFRTKARKAKKDFEIGLIIIDYLQLMRGIKEKGSQVNREQEIGSISRELKAVAKELDVPVIALSQLSRGLESRPGANGKRPKLSDLRESGSIEQDADVVLFLYRPEYYGITEDEQGRSTKDISEIIVAKHRHGETGTAVLKFTGKYTKFADMESFMGIGGNSPSPFGGIQPSNFYEKDNDEDEYETPF